VTRLNLLGLLPPNSFDDQRAHLCGSKPRAAAESQNLGLVATAPGSILV